MLKTGSSQIKPPNEFGYGIEDASYKAAGELEGITRLVNTFYDYMDGLEEAELIRRMHNKDLTEPRKKLAYFLSGWLGGPRLFSETYGPIHIPQFHRNFKIGGPERDAWLLCMSKAIDKQPYPDGFKTYLLTELRVPAERIKVVSESTRKQR